MLKNAFQRFKKRPRDRADDYALRLPNERGARYVFAKLGTYFFGAAYNDIRFGALKTVHSGEVALRSKAAIYLIFPSTGVLASHFDALAFMLANGYAPVIVSNVALSKADRRALLEHAHLVIERHNFGYDFGGYRDAVLALQAELPRLQALAIFNDSSWFPVSSEQNWLQEAEAKNLDYVGAASHFGVPIQRPKDFRTLEWSYNTEHPFFHYCSYALWIGPAILRDKAFLKFWRRFPATDIKRLVVRRGEAGLTQWVIRRGYRHGSTLDMESLGAEIRALPSAALKKLVTDLPIYPGQNKLKEQHDLVVADPDAPDADRANIVLCSILLQGVGYAIMGYLIERRNFSFLKKSPLWLSETSSKRLLAFIETLPGENADRIRAEATNLAAKLSKEAVGRQERPARSPTSAVSQSAGRAA